MLILMTDRMDSEHEAVRTSFHEMTPVSISSRLVPNPPSSTPFEPPARSTLKSSLPIPEAVAPNSAVSIGLPCLNYS
ncbi:hypothetical protein Tco_0199910 [Tanacetum coccineum]